MKKRLISILLTAAMLTAPVISAGAAELDAADTGSEIEAAIVAAEYAEVGSELVPTAALPSYYSSRDNGFVTPVRRQVNNTCWAYSSTASLETLMIKNRKTNQHLSTTHMNYFGCLTDRDTGWYRSYSDAGFPYIALGYLTSFGTITDNLFDESKTESDYNASIGKIYPYTLVDSIIYLTGSDIDTVKTAVYEYGAAIGNFHYDSVCITSDQRSYNCDIEGLSTSQLNGHAISVIGWDDSYSKENFTEDHRPTTNGAWLCKNSWGTTYGDGGFFWISYEDRYLFDRRFGPSYALTGYSDMTAVRKVKQNEVYGATYEFNDVKEKRPSMNKMTYVNVLDFSDGYHNIEKVVFESTSEGSHYTVYYIPVEDNGAPTDNTDRWTLLANGTIEYQGYTGIDVDFSAPVGKGAIGVQIEENADGDFGIGIDEWLTRGGSYLFKPDSTYGQSYLIGYNTEPTDIMKFYYDSYEDEIGGTFVIKALCSNDDTVGDVDRDKEFDVTDVTCTQRILAELLVPDSVQTRFADFDNDGDIQIIDATLMQRRLAGIM